MDTPSQESGELSVDAAANLFTNIIDPQVTDDEPKVDTEIDPKPNAADNAAEPEPNAQDEGGDAPITITVDGKQVTLTTEQIAEAYKSGLRQADYTAKTMAVAEQRKAAEAESTKAQQERAAYAQNLQRMAAQLEGALQEQAGTDWDALLASDPVEYLRQQHLANRRQAALQQNLAEQNELAQKIQADTARQFQSHIETQQQELLAKLPEWKDEAKAKSEREALKEYLKTQGYDEASVNGINDHKAVILSRKAMLYDQMMAKAQAAAKRVTTLPTKVERPGVLTDRNPLDGRTSAMRRLEKTGRVEDAARVFASLL